MNKKIRLIMLHEIYTLVSRPSFWIVLLGLPLLSFIIMGGVSLVNSIQGSPGGENSLPLVGDLSGIMDEAPEDGEQSSIKYSAYYDEGGLLAKFPPDFDHEGWVQVETLDDGLDLLRGESVERLYVIPSDYAQSLRVVVYTRGGNAILPEMFFVPLRQAIGYNLLADEALWEHLQAPILTLDEERIAPTDEGMSTIKNPLQLFIPYGVMTALFLAIAGSASLMLNSIAGEKENRVMEVLINSARPTELMSGKIIGLGLVGLLQVTVWALTAYAALHFSGRAFSLPREVLPEPAVVGWVIVFFILGYLLYGALMAGMGALVPNLREASQVTLLVSLPMWVPFVLITALLNAPGGGLSVALSMIPFTAPQAMILRLIVSHPPLWHPFLAAALMAVTIVLVMRFSARLFHAQTLMTGQRFTPKAFYKAITGR